MITGSEISNNTADNQGGAAKLYSDDSGGGDATNITIQNSTFTGNSAGSPTSNGYGGALTLYGHDETNDVTVSASTFTNNTSTGGGGAIEFWGTGGPVVVENSTFTGNSAGNITSNYDGGGAISSYNAEDLPRTVRNSTIVGNTSAAEGGGIVRNSEDSPTYAGPDDLTLSSTIVSGNTAATGPDLGEQDGGAPSGSFVTGFSLIGSTAGATLTESPAGSNIIGQDPQLGALGDNGGPTQTLLPALSSPVVNAGIANGLSTDQRGLARTALITSIPNKGASDGTDIGAVEIQSASCQGAFVPSKTGTDADETITGTDGPDAISAAGGNDTVNALKGNDCATGDAGNER